MLGAAVDFNEFTCPNTSLLLFKEPSTAYTINKIVAAHQVLNHNGDSSYIVSFWKH